MLKRACNSPEPLYYMYQWSSWTYVFVCILMNYIDEIWRTLINDVHCDKSSYTFYTFVLYHITCWLCVTFWDRFLFEDSKCSRSISHCHKNPVAVSKEELSQSQKGVVPLVSLHSYPHTIKIYDPTCIWNFAILSQSNSTTPFTNPSWSRF